MDEESKTYAVHAVTGSGDLEDYLNAMASKGYDLKQVLAYDSGMAIYFVAVMKRRPGI